MRALVTGGAGFIGSNLVDALLDRGDEVTVVDNLATGKRENLSGALSRGAGFEEADIRDAERMRSVFAAARPDIVFHLAAQIDVRKSIEDPAWDAGVNVVGTINVLEAARLSGVKRVVNTSTGGAIYGEADVMPTPESGPAAADGRLRAEQVLRRGLLRLVRAPLRPVVGHPALRQRLRARARTRTARRAWWPSSAARSWPARRRSSIGDGRQTRDYTYVGDIVAANLAAAAHPEAHGAYNIGTGTESTVIDVLSALRLAAGLGEERVQPEFAPARTGELQRSSLDVTRARAELGFTADTDLVAGMKPTLEWAREDAGS